MKFFPSCGKWGVKPLLQGDWAPPSQWEQTWTTLMKHIWTKLWLIRIKINNNKIIIIIYNYYYRTNYQKISKDLNTWLFGSMFLFVWKQGHLTVLSFQQVLAADVWRHGWHRYCSKVFIQQRILREEKPNRPLSLWFCSCLAHLFGKL